MTTLTGDRRIRKTKLALQKSLATLFHEKDLSSITIKELTDSADIHRSTFYTHYEDIFALYTEIENQVIQELTYLVKENMSLDLQIYYQLLLDYVDEHKVLSKILFSHHTPQSFLERLRILFKNACFKSWGTLMKKEEISIELDYLAEYHVQGSFTIIKKWVDANFDYSKTQLADIISSIDFQITTGLTERTLQSY